VLGSRCLHCPLPLLCHFAQDACDGALQERGAHALLDGCSRLSEYPQSESIAQKLNYIDFLYKLCVLQKCLTRLWPAHDPYDEYIFVFV
jgi:hypothetical protein